MSGWRNWKGPKDPILEDGKTIPYEDCEEILTYESNVTQNLDEKTQYEKFQEAFCQLSIRESTVILARFWEKLNLEEVGKVLGGISRERVRQIEAKALRKLRHPIRMQIYFCPFEYKLYQAEMERREEVEQQRERALHSKWRLIKEESERKRRETRNRNLKERAERNSVEARKKSEKENKDAIERHQRWHANQREQWERVEEMTRKAMEEKKAKEDYYNSPEAVKERAEEERERNMHKIATARAAATRLAEQQQIVRENMMENLSMKNGTVCCRPTQLESIYEN